VTFFVVSKKPSNVRLLSDLCGASLVSGFWFHLVSSYAGLWFHLVSSYAGLWFHLVSSYAGLWFLVSRVVENFFFEERRKDGPREGTAPDVFCLLL